MGRRNKRIFKICDKGIKDMSTTKSPKPSAADTAEQNGQSNADLKKRSRLSAFLKKWRRPKMSWEHTEKQVSLFFSILLKALLFTLLFGLVWLIYKGLTNDQFTMEEFEVPIAFQQGGYSGRVVARQVQDRVAQIREKASILRSDSLQISAAHAPSMNVTVMGFGFSLESLIYYARSVFGKETKTISGELTELDEDLKLHLRVTGRPLMTFSEQLNSKNRSQAFDTLLQQAAEHIMKFTDPHSLSIYQAMNQRWDDALATVRYNINTYQKEPAWAYWTWGYILTKQQHYPEAEQKLKKALELDPTLHFIWTALSANQRLQYKNLEAKETLERAIALHPERASMWQSLGWMYVSNRQYDKALEAIDKAIELEDDVWWYHSNRGEMMAQQMRFLKRTNPDTVFSRADTADVVQSFRKAFKVTEGNTNGVMALYQAYQFSNQPDSAWKMLELSVELDPDNGYSWHIMQQRKWGEEKYRESIEYGHEAVDAFIKMSLKNNYSELTYKRQSALNLLAMAYYSIEEFDRALVIANEAIAVDPNIATPYTTLAEIYGLTGRKDEFYETLEIALVKGFSMQFLIDAKPYDQFVHEPRFQELKEKYMTKG